MKTRKFKTQDSKSCRALWAILILQIAFTVNSKAQIAAGGNYSLTQEAVAAGGATDGVNAIKGGSFTLQSTTGQSAAGGFLQNQFFQIYSGFWTPDQYAPTAASVTIGGRVATQSGRGITNVRLTLTCSNGETRFAASGAFGYYRFADVQAGETCVLAITAKRFVFNNPVQALNIGEDRFDIDFIAAN